MREISTCFTVAESTSGKNVLGKKGGNERGGEKLSEESKRERWTQSRVWGEKQIIRENGTSTKNNGKQDEEKQ